MRTEHIEYDLVCMHCPIKFILSNGKIRGADSEFLRNLSFELNFLKTSFS